MNRQNCCDNCCNGCCNNNPCCYPEKQHFFGNPCIVCPEGRQGPSCFRAFGNRTNSIVFHYTSAVKAGVFFYPKKHEIVILSLC